MSIFGKHLSPYALLSISGLLAASDQAVKWLVQQSMAYGESISVTSFFNWVHVWNTGAAFSLFANGGGWQRYFFIGIAVVVSIFLIKLILENRHKGEAIAYSLILGGALAKYDLLVIDELGYLPMTRQARYNLFQLINSLYEYRSIILTTNKDFTSWGEFFHDDNVAVPIIDRVIHHSHIFMLGGESYRLKQKVTS